MKSFVAVCIVGLLVLACATEASTENGPLRRVLKKRPAKTLILPPPPPPVVVTCRDKRPAAGKQVILPNGLPAQTGPASTKVRVVNCAAVNMQPKAACIVLDCYPIPPAPCSDKKGNDPNPNPSCSWNLKPNCSSPYPVQPRQRWTFGFMTTDMTPFITNLYNNIGFRYPPFGKYDC